MDESKVKLKASVIHILASLILGIPHILFFSWAISSIWNLWVPLIVDVTLTVI